MKTILRKSGEQSFLKDAIRDLVIVIVGILAALWLESWWQERLDRQEERQMLSNLRTEFELNNNDLADVMRSLNEVVSRTDALMGVIEGPINDETKADFLTKVTVGAPRFFDPRHGQLTSEINSGRLRLISNNELRGMIADWPSLAADMDMQRTVFIEAMSHGLGSTARRSIAPPNSRFESDIDRLINSLEFYNQLRSYRDNLGLILRESQTVKDTTDSIIEMINLESGVN